MAEEQRLKAAIDGTNAAIAKQASLHHSVRPDALAAGMSAASVTRQRQDAASRRMIDAMGAPARAAHAAAEVRAAVQAEHVRKRASASGDLIAGMGSAGRREAERIAQSRRVAEGMGASGRLAREETERAARDAEEARAARRADRRDAVGTIAAGTGLYLGHKGKEIGLAAIDAAASMDYAVRYQHIATDVSEATQQKLLLPQAKRIGQETKFSNEDVVEAQTATMQGLPYKDPDLKAKVGAAIVEQARNWAVLFRAPLPSSSEGVRSFLQNTNKDISTPEKAEYEARRGTNLIIKAAKLGGMDNADAQQFLKFGIPTATQSGFSDTTAMALGALARRSGLQGDEAGVFIRAASSKLISPTREGREAEIMAGIDRSKYQTMPEQLSNEAFEKIGKGRFGLKLNDSQHKRLSGMFRDGDLLQNDQDFTAKVTDAVGESFDKVQKGPNKGKLKAQDAQKIAKLASQFYRMSVESTNVQGLLEAHLASPTFTTALRNKFYTDKHGGKAGILGTHFDQFKDDRAALEHVTQEPNFGSDRAKYMTQGLGGAIDNLKGSFETAVLNLGTANAPIVQKAADGLAAFGDALANLPQEAVQAGTALALVGGTAATATSALTLLGALTGSTSTSAVAAAMAGTTFTGAPILAGATAGGWLDWNLGGNTGALGMLTGNESDHQKVMRYLREREAGNAAAASLGYRAGGGPALTLPADVAGGGAGQGFSTEYRTSRGFWGDFLWGQNKGSMPLPGFGSAEGKAIPVEVRSLPEGAGAKDKIDPSGQLRAQDNTLDKAATASATAANGGRPIEATVKPDQIIARVDSLPPVTGTATVTVEPQRVDISLNSDLLNARIDSRVSAKVATIPLASSGARPGAVSMPGAASTPGSK